MERFVCPAWNCTIEPKHCLARQALTARGHKVRGAAFNRIDEACVGCEKGREIQKSHKVEIKIEPLKKKKVSEAHICPICGNEHKKGLVCSGCYLVYHRRKRKGFSEEECLKAKRKYRRVER